MRKFITLSLALLLSAAFSATVNAGPNNNDAAKDGQAVNSSQNAQNKGKKNAYSVDKEYKKRLEAKKKAMKLRSKTIQQNKNN
jgi:hypothetical protein